MIAIDELKIEQYPTDALKSVAKEVTEITPEIIAIGNKMIELCDAENGLGLAANQVGVLHRMFVGPSDFNRERGLEIFINPVILEYSDGIESFDESCLSLTGIHGVVNRPRSVKMRATMVSGDIVTVFASGLTARVWQHEIDHLNGLSIIHTMLPKQKKRNKFAIERLENM